MYTHVEDLIAEFLGCGWNIFRVIGNPPNISNGLIIALLDCFNNHLAHSEYDNSCCATNMYMLKVSDGSRELRESRKDRLVVIQFKLI